MRRVAPEGHKAFTWPPPPRRVATPTPARLPPETGPGTQVAMVGAAALIGGLALYLAATERCEGSGAFCGFGPAIYGTILTLAGLVLLAAGALAGATRRALGRDAPRHRTLK